MRISGACKLGNINCRRGESNPHERNARRILRTLRVNKHSISTPRNLNNISTHISIAKTGKQTIYDSFRHIKTAGDASMMPVIFISQKQRG